MLRLFSILLFSVCALYALPLKADNLAFDDFGRLPILHEGRVKPLDSFARIQMKAISGAENPNGLDARGWLARILFDPASVQDEKFFIIRSSDIKHQMGLDEKAKRFSLADLGPGLNRTAEEAQILSQKPSKELTPEQAQLVNLHERAAELARLGRSVSLVLPVAAEIPETYRSALQDKTLNYLSLSAIDQSLLAQLQSIIRAKGEDPANYTDEERKIALLAFRFDALRSSGGDNGLFKVMPGSWSEGQNRSAPHWFSPWQLVMGGEGSPDNGVYLKLWSEMASAYRASDGGAWERAVTKALEHIEVREIHDKTRFEAEMAYTLIKPFLMSEIFYALAFAALLIFLMSEKYGWVGFAKLATLAALAFHASGIAARVYILERPPVGTLYESMLFVALVCALLGALASRGSHKPYGLMGGVFSALIMLLIAPMILDGADSLGVLVAVLNTNFWLATHVLVITAGYGVCVLCAALAHFYLGLRLSKPKNDKAVLAVYNAAYKLSVLALLLTAVGTVLGGIWADQSWGRFWGWDPKENGALLIVLWLIWAQHGRQGGLLRDVPFMAMLGALNIIVALAWFGVNLLNVGLHSYGFIQGVALGLGAFCGAEIVLIGALWASVRIMEKRRKTHVA